MIHRLLCACVGPALVGVLAVPAHVAAKPPDLPEDGTFTATPNATPPMPKQDADVTCPYLRQKRIDRQASQPAAPDMGRDVLENLKRLKRADKLLDRAKELARAGRLAESIDCCARAAKLCPGSPCAKRATDTMLNLALGFGVPPGASEEATEPDLDTPEGRKRLEAEWERIWFSEMPSQITPKWPHENTSSSEEDKDIEFMASELIKAKQLPSPGKNYEFEVGTNADGGLRMCADCSLGGNVYHVRYKQGCLLFWKSADAGKTKR